MNVRRTVRRETRKVEHMAGVLALGDRRGAHWFEHVSFVPNCAPELHLDEVRLDTTLCGLRLASPLIVNAMTGGAEEARAVNRTLARASRRHGLAMAVGSQTAALRDASLEDTYTVVRDVHPDGIVIGNVGMGTRAEAAERAVRLIGANLLQVHFNAAQELFMAEGDRDFREGLYALAEVAKALSVPVIAKEVGQGVAAEEAVRFVAAGACGIDVGGRGGTNFMAVETWRRGAALSPEWGEWGIPTAAALCDVVDGLCGRADVVASGGVRSGYDIAKAMALGAASAGVAAPFLRLACGPEPDVALDAYIHGVHADLRMLLALSGCRTWDELRGRPLVIAGALREWLLARGRIAFLDKRGRGR